MGETILEIHARKVNKIILIIFGSYQSIYMLLSLIKKDTVGASLIPTLISTLFLIWGVYSHVKKKNEKYIGMLLCLSVVLNILIIFQRATGDQRSGMIVAQLIPALAMAVYFNKRNFIVFTVIFDMMLVFF